MRQPRGQRRRLARARAGQHQQRAFRGQHRLALGRIETGQIGRLGIGREGGGCHAEQLGNRAAPGNRYFDRFSAQPPQEDDEAKPAPEPVPAASAFYRRDIIFGKDGHEDDL
jgi:hypothetical protein